MFEHDKINLVEIDITRTSGSKRNGWHAELRRCREERRGNGVKNLKRAKPFLCILPVKLAIQNGREPIYQTHISDSIDIWLDYNCYLIYKHIFNKENIQKRTVDLF
jgi:hypothetical protein